MGRRRKKRSVKKTAAVSLGTMLLAGYSGTQAAPYITQKILNLELSGIGAAVQADIAYIQANPAKLAAAVLPWLALPVVKKIMGRNRKIIGLPGAVNINIV